MPRGTPRARAPGTASRWAAGSSCTSRRPIPSRGWAPRTRRSPRRCGRRSRNSCHRQTRRVASPRNGVTMGPLILLVVLVVVVAWLVGAYNGLISLKNQTLNAFKQIDVQLKRRHDLIPNLVNAVKGAMDFERSTLEAVIQARNQAVQVDPSRPRGVQRNKQSEHALYSAVPPLMVVVEQ